MLQNNHSHILFSPHDTGFTLIEVMVSISIISAIMMVVLFTYAGFTDKLALSAGEQEVAIAVRRAQVYGLSVKEVIPAGGNFNSAYGIHFDLRDPSYYYLFVDTDRNQKYDELSGCGETPTECVEKIPLRDGVQISALCTSEDNCYTLGRTRTGLDISFIRPDPDPRIVFIHTSGALISDIAGKIELTSPKGIVKKVTIENSGQISVE